MGQPKPTGSRDGEAPPKTGDVIGRREPLAPMIPGEFERRPIPREQTHEGDDPGEGIDEEPTPA